ncbi:hypothetical protein GOP47_0023841 [Adiantum capillus-veneris]|uniref:Uncharacterized protein n=1 Tax=Adiantum capillus-veneris TaxID=13818 RepID=A0A9D4U6S7_ADICA|nr:hypothetical protein GOP47_0023841 [Adiantum capillus-veneris]
MLLSSFTYSAAIGGQVVQDAGCRVAIESARSSAGQLKARIFPFTLPTEERSTASFKSPTAAQQKENDGHRLIKSEITSALFISKSSAPDFFAIFKFTRFHHSRGRQLRRLREQGKDSYPAAYLLQLHWRSAQLSFAFPVQKSPRAIKIQILWRSSKAPARLCYRLLISFQVVDSSSSSCSAF